MVKIDVGNMELYVDGRLHKDIIKMRKTVNMKDMDRVIPIDGAEGSGKSVFAQQLAKLLDSTFNINRMCMTSEEFISAVTKASKGQAVVFDEAFTGLGSRSALSTINKLIVSMMMEMRQKNLFVIIVLPTFFLLDKYVAIFRSKELFHVYLYKGKRGYWRVYNSNKKKYLYLKGKKELHYDNKIKPCYKGRFLEKYTIDEMEYRKKKGDALKEKDRKPEQFNKHFHERDACIYIMHKKYNVSHTDISKDLTEIGVKKSRPSICGIVSKFEDLKGLAVNSQMSI